MRSMHPCRYIYYILKVLDLTRKTQTRLHAESAHASNATMSLRAFICVCVRLFAFAYICMRFICATTCVRMRARRYIDKFFLFFVFLSKNNFYYKDECTIMKSEIKRVSERG